MQDENVQYCVKCEKEGKVVVDRGGRYWVICMCGYKRQIEED